MEEKKNKKRMRPYIKRFLIKTGAIILAIWAIISFVATPYRSKDNCMYPALHSGDLGIYFRLQEPYVDSVVMYKDDSGNVRIGRVIASSGDTVEFLENGGYEVNGYSALEEVPYETYADDLVGQTIEVDEDEYFILNDYRSLDNDSRTLGKIKRSQIIGNLVFVMRIREF